MVVSDLRFRGLPQLRCFYSAIRLSDSRHGFSVQTTMRMHEADTYRMIAQKRPTKRDTIAQ